MYKKIIFCCICFALLSAFYNTGYSQDKPMKLGIRGGVNLANINQDFETVPVDIEDLPLPLQISFDKSNYTTFGFGGFFEYWFSNTIGIQVNALYNMKGVKAKADFNVSIDTLGFIAGIQGDIEGTVKLTYIGFPVFAKIAFGGGNPVRPYLIVGPELGFRNAAKVTLEMKAKIEVAGYSVTESFDEEEDIKDQLESTEFALNIGGGVEFPLGSAKGFLEARYGLGLSKINKATGEEVVDIFGDKDVKNNIFYINVGIIF